MAKTLVTGAIAYDVMLGFEGSFADTIRPEEIATLSVSHFSPHYSRHHGGTGANIAWHIRLLGGDPLLVGAVGNDGGEYLALLRERGISTQFIPELNDQVTATAIIGTDSGERQIAFYHPGADSFAPWPDLSQERDDIGMAIVSPRDMQVMLHAAAWCGKFGVPLVFDPGQQVHRFGADELLRLTKQSRAVIANEYEWNILRGALGCTEENIHDFVPLLVVTRGERGALWVDSKGRHEIPACTADAVVNPTGAGDAFRAGFVLGLQSSWPTEDSLRLGAALASFVVEIEGTLLEALDFDMLRGRARRAYGEDLPALRFSR